MRRSLLIQSPPTALLVCDLVVTRGSLFCYQVGAAAAAAAAVEAEVRTQAAAAVAAVAAVGDLVQGYHLEQLWGS